MVPWGVVVARVRADRALRLVGGFDVALSRKGGRGGRCGSGLLGIACGVCAVGVEWCVVRCGWVSDVAPQPRVGRPLSRSKSSPRGRRVLPRTTKERHRHQRGPTCRASARVRREGGRRLGGHRAGRNWRGVWGLKIRTTPGAMLAGRLEKSGGLFSFNLRRPAPATESDPAGSRAPRTRWCGLLGPAAMASMRNATRHQQIRTGKCKPPKKTNKAIAINNRQLGAERLDLAAEWLDFVCWSAQFEPLVRSRPAQRFSSC